MKMRVITLGLLILLTFTTSSTTKTEKKCRVLALEGGGDKGAYQSGALKGLVDNVPDVRWDVITGVSVGSMDAAAMAIFDVGRESEAVDLLLRTWRGIKGRNDIYQNWWGGPLDGLFFKTGLYDTSPLRVLLKEVIQANTVKRKFVIGATNYQTGEFETWDEETLFKAEYEFAITASGSVPGLFPLTQFRGNFYMDGGVRVNVDIPSGINKCLDMGFEDDQIEIDVVLLNSKLLTEEGMKNVHPLKVLMRVFEIYGYDHTMKDFEYAQQAFPKVSFRYVVAPSKALPSGSFPLIFSPQQIEEMIQIGIEDAKNVVEQGKGKNLEMLLEVYHREVEGRFRKRKSKIAENTNDTNDRKDDIQFLE